MPTSTERDPSVTMKTTASKETHLFIIWEHGRSAEAEIIADIRSKFTIVQIYEITWAPEKFSENLSRFYGTSLPPNSRKEQHCGTGPFLAIVVEDESPQYQVRTTTKGDEHVNTKLFESKALHREWTGGGHRVHGTNSVVEADHNMTMLFGKNSSDLREAIKQQKKRTKIIPLHRDIEGSDGWDNLRQLFYVFNNTLRYVVLRNFDQLPDDYYADKHGDIDLLVDNARDAIFIANAQKVFKSKGRVHCTIRIDNEDVRFDFRSVGDGYYDTAWQLDILDKRELKEDCFYVPSSEDYFYSWLYHALVQKPAVANDYINRLNEVARSLKIRLAPSKKNRMNFDRATALKVLIGFLKKHGYHFSQPNDKSVYINAESIRAGQAEGVLYKKDRITPFRNYLKYGKSKGKHYTKKVRKILNRNINKILTTRYEKK